MSSPHEVPAPEVGSEALGLEPSLRIDVELDPSLELAMQQNGVSPLESIAVENRSDVELRDVVIRIRADPEFAQTLEARLASLPAKGRHLWEAPTLALSRSFLAGLRERVAGALHVEVFAKGRRVAAERREVAVLPYDHWGGLQSLPELACAFVLPNHPALVPWLRRAAGLLEQWTGDPSLSGYQSLDRVRVSTTAAAIFHALQESGIAYINPPASFEQSGQKVRTADRIEEEKLATCLDLAFVAAGCLEQAGLHALVVLVQGHAFAGVWLDETSFAEPAIEDSALLVKRIQLGELAVFDPTLATSRPRASFEDAVRAACKRLEHQGEFLCAIDVARSRKGGVRPLPLRARGVELAEEAGISSPTAPSTAPALAIPRRIETKEDAATPATRIEQWKRHLLDLTNRNRLLNFAETKKTIPLECAELGPLEDLLAAGRALTLRARLPEMQPAGTDVRAVPQETIRELCAAELDAGRLVTRLTEAELSTRLTEIFRSAREGLEEGGASGLYLALGFLEWFESPASDRPRPAPLLLVPVDLQRGSIRQGFKLTRAADETRFNTTLLELLRTEHHVAIPGLDPLPEDEQGVDVDLVIQGVTAALRDVPRWRVIHEARLGFFKFTKFLMWKDLDEQSEVLVQNPLVAHLVHQPERPFDADWRKPDPGTLDDLHRTADLCCPALADSSQLAAVVAAADGRSFVLEGPPGTGKSQTITNLIAHCLAQGKTVLFVSEKTAALEVVFDRLKAIGLERFCLELHSNKASKLAVVQSLGRSLTGAREHSPAGWSALADELDRVRAELNAYARAIRREHENGLSIFRATSLLTSWRDAPCLDLGWKALDEVERDVLAAGRAALREAENALRGTGDPRAHPLAGVDIQEVGPGLADRLRAQFAELCARLDGLAPAAGELLAALEIDLSTASLRDLRLAVAAGRALIEAPEEGFGLLARVDPETEALAEKVCALGGERDAKQLELQRRFDPSLLELDLSALRARARKAAGAWVVARWFQTRALRKELSSVTREKVALSLQEIRDSIELALEQVDVEARLAEALSELRKRARARWRAETAPWPEIRSTLAWALSARTAIAEAAGDPALAKRAVERLVSAVERAGGIRELREPVRRAVSGLDACLAAAEAVASALRLAASDEWHAAIPARRCASWRERMERIEPALSQLKPWALWRRLRARLVLLPLTAIVEAAERGTIQSGELLATFERSFHEAWLDRARAREPALRDFLALSHEQRILRFRELDERCLQLSRSVVAAQLSARVPSASTESVPGSELGVLQRQLQLQRRHLAPRQLFQQTKSVVQKLKPCFLMSPISVAQYLPPGALSFDLVVFDEASQIPTWDAVGAIARGRQAVVVGDSKQLPPTSFFEAVITEEEDASSDSVIDLESILDECRAANVPSMDLNWHYRSRHESLITFSNRKYYENRLHTFPAARSEGLGVQWRHVAAGVYDRGRSATNRAEAEAIVAEVLRRLRDAELARWSIGIVTFSAAQQKKVEDLLDEERRKDPALDAFFIPSEERRETLFVKNLENVQGDERDVILFSVCYGPDESGRVAMSFGPLNQQGGARRLNVAVTRARRELVVFSTLTADQIVLARTRARGVADLKAFLSYAQHGARSLPAQAAAVADADDFESPLEKEIGEALRAKGHAVDAQIGCSGYRIDLAVVDPERPGNYLLGIECDGRNYHSAKTARDRDRLRQSVLEGLGWQLVRVWSSDWWESREVELARLCEAIDEAHRRAQASRSAPPVAPLAPPDAPTEAATAQDVSVAPSDMAAASVESAGVVAETPPLSIYRRQRGGALGSQQDFYEPERSADIEEALLSVVRAEGPISLELAASRVAERFGFERTRKKVVERIDELARSAGLARTVQNERSFLWPAEIDPRSWRGFRTSAPEDEDLRDVADLPLEEIGNATAHVLLANGACPRRDLQRALSRLFGFRALGTAVAAQMDAGIDLLIGSGRARLDADGRVELVR